MNISDACERAYKEACKSRYVLWPDFRDGFYDGFFGGRSSVPRRITITEEGNVRTTAAKGTV